MVPVDRNGYLRIKPKRSLHGILVIAMLIAISSRGKYWDTPTSVSVVAGQENTGLDESTFVCTAFRDGLNRSGLVFDLHVSLPRDQNDYLVFDTSPNGNALSIQINEERQFVVYFGNADSGIEISRPSPEFAAELNQQTSDLDGNPIFDNLNTTIFLTANNVPTETVAIEGYTSTPFLSSVVKVVPASFITNVACSGMRALDTGIAGSKVGIDMGLTGRTSKAALLRPIYFKRGIASLLILVWLISLWITREEKNSELSNKSENVTT